MYIHIKCAYNNIYSTIFGLFCFVLSFGGGLGGGGGGGLCHQLWVRSSFATWIMASSWHGKHVGCEAGRMNGTTGALLSQTNQLYCPLLWPCLPLSDTAYRSHAVEHDCYTHFFPTTCYTSLFYFRAYCVHKTHNLPCDSQTLQFKGWPVMALKMVSFNNHLSEGQQMPGFQETGCSLKLKVTQVLITASANISIFKVYLSDM